LKFKLIIFKIKIFNFYKGETGVKFDPISTNIFSPESRAVTPA
jgi:hypothetical protein